MLQWRIKEAPHHCWIMFKKNTQCNIKNVTIIKVLLYEDSSAVVLQELTDERGTKAWMLMVSF